MQLKQEHFPILSLYITFLFFILLSIFSSDIPFFWDGITFSNVTDFYFKTNFSSFILPTDLDTTGSPLLHWMYVALMWKLFGKTLIVSHLALLPFLLGIAWEYYKLAKRFLPPNIIPYTMLLLLMEPTFITQCVLMGYDVPMLYFFLLALNSLLSGNGLTYIIAILLLGLSNARGILMDFSLLLFHLLLFANSLKGSFLKQIKLYIPAVIIIGGWTFYHYYQTGWFFINSASSTISDREIVPVSMMIRQCVYLFWYLFDFGRVFIWLFIFVGLYFLRYKPLIKSEILNLVAIVICTLLVCIIFFSPLSNPISHRYLLMVFLPSQILFCFIIHNLHLKKSVFIVVGLMIPIMLLTGNFWLYGGGFSNGWDTSLKGLFYFKPRNQMIEYVKHEKINPHEIGAKFPLYHDLRYSDLVKESFCFTNMEELPIEEFRFVLLSNVSNLFTVREKEKLKKDWILLSEYRNGEIFIQLFKNPVELRID
ncbi:MAG: hypothetical protein V1781_04270 [Bacteroidota bacterium]